MMPFMLGHAGEDQGSASDAEAGAKGMVMAAAIGVVHIRYHIMSVDYTDHLPPTQGSAMLQMVLLA
jgi:hypothetical protein